MVLALPFACTACAASGAVVADDCDIPGHVVQWQADYCLFVEATDDLIAAQDCIDRERMRRFRSDCEAKRHYKRAWCEATTAAGVRTGSAEACERDPEAMGNVVRHDGL